MAGNPIRLVLSDIDGTILPKGQRVVSDRIMASMRACIEAGVHVGPASGRNLNGVLPAFGGSRELCATAMVTNGMPVYIDGELVHEMHLDPSQLEEVVRFCERHEGCGLICFVGPRVKVVRGTLEGLLASFPSYGDIADVTGELPSEPVVKANVFTPTDPAETAGLFEAIKREVPGMDYSMPMAGFLNMTPKGWNKGAAIDVMCERLGIGLAEVCVFGDANTDVEMLSHVPCSVAVGNASEDAKAAAAHVIGRCEDDAVADVLDVIATGAVPFA